MVLTGKQILEHGIVSDLRNADKQLQSCGIDLTVNRIEKYGSTGSIDFDNSKRELPRLRDAGKIGDFWHLMPGPYLVTFNETVSVPDDCMGLARPRSTLLRCGATMETAIWDPGYTGKSQCMLVVHNPSGLKVYDNAKVMQIVFLPLDEKCENLYSGVYQGEGLKHAGNRATKF